MFRFGKKSERVLGECHYGLDMVMRDAIRYVNFSCICGHRGKREQDIYYLHGTSKVKWPLGKHNKTPSEAIDIIPYPLDRYPNKDDVTFAKDLAEWYIMGTVVMMCAKKLNIPIRWGGDWDGDFKVNDQTFDDLGHFEIVLIGD